MPEDIRAPKLVEDHDGRYLPRWEVKNRISFQLDDDDTLYHGNTQDLSCSGLCMESEGALAPGQTVQMTIYLSDEVSIHVQGRVVWIKGDDDENLSGVHFSNLTGKAQETILNYAFELDDRKVMDHFFEGWK